MTIRPATIADDADVRRMAERFLGPDGPYAGRFQVDAEAVGRLLAGLIKPGSLALVLEGVGGLVGMLGAFVFDHPITGERVASELCWWVEPEARGSRIAVQMLEQAETWAKASGAKWFEMIAPGERVGWFYERLGYERVDIHYMKVLR